jgi:hypothetical protein
MQFRTEEFKRLVRELHPLATCQRGNVCYKVTTTKKPNARVLGFGRSPFQAWMKALVTLLERA